MNLLFIFLLLLPIIIYLIHSNKEGFLNTDLNIAYTPGYSSDTIDELRIRHAQVGLKVSVNPAYTPRFFSSRHFR